MRASPVALLKQADRRAGPRDRGATAASSRSGSEGSLFDLKHDSADDIASAIIGNLSAHKAKSLADGILARLKKS